MDKRAEQFRKRTREENRGRLRIGWRYSGRVRGMAIRYLQRVLDGGGSLGGAARALGVSGLTLKRWHETEASQGSLREVEIVEEEENGRTVLTSPRGYRVEGLSEKSLTRVLEHLG